MLVWKKRSLGFILYLFFMFKTIFRHFNNDVIGVFFLKWWQVIRQDGENGSRKHSLPLRYMQNIAFNPPDCDCSVSIPDIIMLKMLQ